MPPRRMMVSDPNEKADLGAIKKLLVYCRRYLPALIIAVIFAVGSSVATIMGPEKISDLMDEIAKGIASGVDIGAFEEICFTLILMPPVKFYVCR